MKGQMTILAVMVSLMTLIVFLAIIPTIKDVINSFTSQTQYSSVEKFLISLVIPFILIGIISIILLYSKPYVSERI